MDLKDYKDVEIFQEFKRRFNHSCLYSWQISSILTAIGLDRIKTHLKELNLAVRKYNFKQE